MLAVGTDEQPGAFAGRAGEVKKAFRSLQKEVVRRRIDEMGTREPTIQGQGDNRILVEVGFRRGRFNRHTSFETLMDHVANCLRLFVCFWSRHRLRYEAPST